MLKWIDEELWELQLDLRMDDGLEQQQMGDDGSFVLDPYFGCRTSERTTDRADCRTRKRRTTTTDIRSCRRVQWSTLRRTWTPTAGFGTSDCRRVAWRATNSDSRCTSTIACA